MNPLALLSLEPSVMLTVLVFMLIFVTLFLLFGATAAQVPGVTLTSAFIAAISMLAAQFVVVVVLSAVPVVGGILGFIFGVVAMAWIIKMYFNLTWGMAAEVWCLAVVAEITAGMILRLYLGIGLMDFVNSFFFVR